MSAPVGSLAGEAALLLDALAQRLAAGRPAVPAEQPAGAGPGAGAESEADAAAAGTDSGTGSDGAADFDAAAAADAGSGAERVGPCPECGHDPGHQASCTSCPLCRLIGLLRGDRPEATARLVDGALAVIESLRALLPAAAAAPAGDGAATPADGEPAARPEGDDASETPALQRIEIQ